MENMIGKEFDNLAQRCVYAFIATCPPFIPDCSIETDPASQQAAYGFITGIYEKLAADPALLGLKQLPDNRFEDWEQYKDKPGLAPAAHQMIRKIEEFIELIWKISIIGKAEDHTFYFDKEKLALKPAAIRQLSVFGITASSRGNAIRVDFPVPAASLQILARISEANASPASKWGKIKPYLLFSRGVFNVGAPWSRKVFASMFDNQTAFDRLLDYLESSGYKRIDNKSSTNQISLDYVKSYGKPDDELKWAWAERTHSGIEIVYEEIRKNQPLIALRIPFFKDLLKNNGQMSSPVRQFIVSTTRKCSNCRYCIQTDKTGTRPLAYETIDGSHLCPLFAGFAYRWKSLDDTLVDNMIEMLKFIGDRYEKK